MGKFFPSSVVAVQWYQIARYGAWFFLSVWLARLFPDKKVVSEYETLMLTSASLSFFWLSGLYDTFIPLYRKSAIQFQRTLVAQTLRTGILLALATAAGTWILTSVLHPNISGATTTAFSIYVFFHSGSFTLEHLWIVRSQKTALMLAGPLYFMVCVLALGLPLALGYSLENALWFLAVVSAIRFFAQLLLENQSLFHKTTGSPPNELLRTAGPVTLAVLLGGSAAYVDSNLVRYSFSSDEFVNFTYGARELPLALLLANSLSLVRSGEIAASKSRKELKVVLHALRRSSLRIMHLVFPLAILLLLCSAPLIEWVFRKSYRDAYLIFDISLLLVIPRMLFPQSVVKAYLKGWALTRISLIELLLNVVLSVVLMQFWGIAGVAAGTVIAYTVEKIFLAVYCSKKLEIKWTEYTPVNAWLLYSLLLSGLYLVKVAGWMAW